MRNKKSDIYSLYITYKYAKYKDEDIMKKYLYIRKVSYLIKREHC